MLVKTQRHGKTRNGHSLQTHCKNGHEFNEINTYISPKSQKRSCKLCTAVRIKERWATEPELRIKQRDHMRRWRAANQERDHKNWTELRRKKKEWLDAQKTACSRCGEADIVCIDFHHTDPAKKDANLSVAIAHWSIARLQKELAKTIMLCANCHRKLHAAEKAEKES